jgi:hypothetical protein
MGIIRPEKSNDRKDWVMSPIGLRQLRRANLGGPAESGADRIDADLDYVTVHKTRLGAQVIKVEQ